MYSLVQLSTTIKTVKVQVRPDGETNKYSSLSLFGMDLGCILLF